MILETINELRKEKKLSISDLAERIGGSPVTLQRNLGKGSKLKIEELEAIIKVFGEKEFYTRILDGLQTLEFVKMDIQDGVVWGVFLVNDKPQFVGCVGNARILVYVKEVDPTIYNRKKIEAAVGKGYELEDIREDTAIVNMWIYQFERKNTQS
jgi:transcriptional regulator with XRE-family HTH domain